MTIDWKKLHFDIIQTKSFLVYTFDGQWDQGVLKSGSTIELDLYASSVHYGQACFEGLKAFYQQDGKIRIFRPELNAKRLQQSCEATAMPSVPVEMFVDACERVVRDNREFVPPFGTNGSLYIRPFVIGTGGMLGLSPSKQYKFIVAVNPVGDYYQGGIGQPVKAIIKHGFDRAAPNGTGHVKLAGNYAPAMRQSQLVKQNGYTVMLFLDCKEQQWIEEFATSNFAAIVLKNDKPVYVTPSSQSVLNSVTNRSLFELAKSLGWQVEKRPIRYEEIKTFDEIAACGTAVVITPVGQIDREFGTLQPLQADPSQWEQPSPAYDISVESIQLKSDFKYFKQLYQHYRDIQNGVQQDSMHWMYPSKGI